MRDEDKSKEQLIIEVQELRNRLNGSEAFLCSFQNKVEKELARKNAFLEGILRYVPEIIFFKDKEGGFIAGNQLLSNLTGKPIEEAIGKTDHDYFDGKIADFFSYELS